MLDDVERSLNSIKHRLQHHPTFVLFLGVNKNVASALPRGFKDTVWRMRKVSIHSAKIALAISRQIEKGKAKQLLKTGDRGNREDGLTRRSIDLSNYWKKDHVCRTYFVGSIMSGKRESGLMKRSKTNRR